MSVTGSNNSTGIVFDLISEGPISLVNGLNSIYFNRTPLANASASVPSMNSYLRGTVNSAGTIITLNQRLNRNNSGMALQQSGSSSNQILVHGGEDEATITNIAAVSGSDESTVTVSSSFFTSAMLTPDGVGVLAEKIRIVGYGPGGEEYIGRVTEVTSGTVAKVTPKITKALTGSPKITYDFLTTGTVTVYSSSFITVTSATLASAIPNTAKRNITTYVTMQGATEPGLTANSDDLNFDGVKVAFKPGSASQTPQSSVPSISSATNSTKIGTTIKQHTDYFGANTKLNNFWGKYKLEYPDGSTGGGEVTINAADVSQGDDSAIDELILTISFPSGLYSAGDFGNDVYKERYGAIFQVFFDYKVGTGSFKTVQMYGPTTAQINAASIIVAANTGTFRKNGPRVSGELRSNSQNAIDFDLRWSIEQFKPFTDWRIRVKKITPDRLIYRGGQQNYIADSVVKQVVTVINDKLSYPHSAYAALSFPSQQLNGEFPDRAYHCYGVEVDIPTNYVTREEAEDGVAAYTRNVSTGAVESTYQVWDGNFVRGYTNNPVWIFREILLNKRWGLGHWLSAENINDYSLYSIARYCDELVPDGNGGTEPRFTGAAYLTKATEAYKVIKDFASTMLAIPYWVDGQIILEGDRRGEPVYTFTKGNIIDGIFSYEGTGNKSRPNQIVVRFNDKDNFYDEDIELVDDIQDMVVNNRVFSEEVVAFGATTRGQAIRYGKWKLLTSKLQKEIVSFRTGENGSFLKPGSIIAIQDADRTAVRYSGRVQSASTTTIALDANVTLAAGQDHTMYIQMDGPATYLAQESATISAVDYTLGDIIPGVVTEEAAEVLTDDSGDPVVVQFSPDMHLEKRPITNSLPYTGSVITVSAFSSTPEADFVWAITSEIDGELVGGSAKNYKILGIREESPGVYGISAAEHVNSKFDILDEEFLSAAPRNVDRYVDLPPVENFRVVKKNSYATDNVVNPKITLATAWSRPTQTGSQYYEDIAEYELLHIDPDGDITVVNVPEDRTWYNFSSTETGDHLFKISAIGSGGSRSKPVEASIFIGNINGAPVIQKNGLPQGGVFDTPIRVAATSATGPTEVIVPSEYTYRLPGGKKITVSGTAPADPVDGSLWYDTGNTQLKEWASQDTGGVWEVVT
jgi:hypothetical protein